MAAAPFPLAFPAVTPLVELEVTWTCPGGLGVGRRAPPELYAGRGAGLGPFFVS